MPGPHNDGTDRDGDEDQRSLGQPSREGHPASHCYGRDPNRAIIPNMEGVEGAARTPKPAAVSAIRAVLAVEAVLAGASAFVNLPLLIKLNQWVAFGAHPTVRYAPVGGPQTHFGMLGSYSVGIPWLGLVTAIALPVLLAGLALLATKGYRWVGAAIATIALLQAITLLIPGLVLLGLLAAPSARRFYWGEQEAQPV